MKKYLPLIEQNVQWAAVGLGSAFVLYMVYGYVVNQPVTAQLGNRTVNLGNVDAVIVDGPAKDLQAAMQNGSATAVNLTVVPVLPKFKDLISNAHDPVATVVLDKQIFDAPTTPPIIPGMAIVQPQPNKPGTTPTPGTLQPVVALAIPAPAFVGLSVGRSTVTPPPPPANPATAAAAPQPDAVQPIQPIQPVQPIQAVANANGGGANTQPTIDKNWVSFHYTIPSAALNQAFIAANVPPVRRSTSFLRVEMIRQEKLPDGQWGNETSVPPLYIAFMDAPAWPQGAPNPQAEQDYITWAQSHAQAILQPVFYTVVKGDLAGLPGDPLQHAGIATVVKAFDPAHPGPPPYTPEQEAAIKQWREQQRQQRQAPRTPTRTTPGQRTPTHTPTRANPRGGGANGGDVAFAPNDAQRPATLHAQVATPRPGGVPVRRPVNPAAATDIMPEDMIGDAAAGGAGSIVQTNNEALNKLAQTIPQTNSFDPAQLVQDVDVVAYDETAEPGKTYRYQMRYHILNPVYGMGALAPNLAQKFELPSEPSPWTNAVEVPPAVNFFLASGGLGGSDSVRLDIFRWQNGDVNRTSQTVVAGDRVGLTDAKTGIDYTTKWTVVDIRTGNGDKYVLLQDDDGNTMRREFKLDSSSPLKKDLDTQATAAAQAAAAANPTTPNGTRPLSPNATANIVGR